MVYQVYEVYYRTRICSCSRLVLATHNVTLLVRTVEAQKLNLQSGYPDLSYVLTR